MDKIGEYIDKAKGLVKDTNAAKEIKQCLTELEALPEDGSIVYKMDREALINDMSGLLLVVKDGRLDDEAVTEEIRRVIGKLLVADEQPDGLSQEETNEKQMIASAKDAACNACLRALDAISSK